MSFDIRRDVLDSIEDINDLLDSYELLFSRIKEREPDNIELAALGTVLHSFYNGVEGIFLLIAKQIDRETPGDSAWHQSLLNQMAAAVKERAPLITSATADLLAPYLKFRHFFRHAYAFMLDWRRLAPLADNLLTVWDRVKEDLMEFCDSLS